jgi:hypothetical protein
MFLFALALAFASCYSIQMDCLAMLCENRSFNETTKFHTDSGGRKKNHFSICTPYSIPTRIYSGLLTHLASPQKSTRITPSENQAARAKNQ